MRIRVALLDNAVKFTDRGSRVLVRVGCDSDVIRLALSAEGPGFSRDGLARAFERFWRDDAARGRTGTGLGLSIVQALVTSAHGTIAIENRSPRGCQVTVTLPALHLPAHANTETWSMVERSVLSSVIRHKWRSCASRSARATTSSAVRSRAALERFEPINELGMTYFRAEFSSLVRLDSSIGKPGCENPLTLSDLRIPDTHLCTSVV